VVVIHLVLGGARSGKSRFAESRVAINQKPVIYVATATTGDDEMRQRIAHHKASRPQDWLLVEEPFSLSEIISQYGSQNTNLIIECMTLWLTNWLCTHDVESWQEEKNLFIDALIKSKANIVIVSNEVGSGVVPMGELSREFADQSGWLNQALAQIADQVTLVVAGCPLVLKPQQTTC
jgi:adenosylcobinamide kinase / adenosylcobinamide-phosphate guanylyltransferase